MSTIRRCAARRSGVHLLAILLLAAAIRAMAVREETASSASASSAAEVGGRERDVSTSSRHALQPLPPARQPLQQQLQQLHTARQDEMPMPVDTTQSVVMAVADGLITLSYFSIPLELLWCSVQLSVRSGPGAAAVRLKPAAWLVILLFVSFILLCGTTHLVAIVVLWNPSATALAWHLALKVVTGVVSMVTAVSLVWLVPLALALPLRAKQLEEEVTTRIQVENTLQREYDALAKLSDVTQSIRRSLDKATILRTATEQLCTSLQLTRCAFAFPMDTVAASAAAVGPPSGANPSGAGGLRAYTGTLHWTHGPVTVTAAPAAPAAAAAAADRDVDTVVSWDDTADDLDAQPLLPIATATTNAASGSRRHPPPPPFTALHGGGLGLPVHTRTLSTASTTDGDGRPSTELHLSPLLTAALATEHAHVLPPLAGSGGADRRQLRIARRVRLPRSESVLADHSYAVLVVRFGPFSRTPRLPAR